MKKILLTCIFIFFIVFSIFSEEAIEISTEFVADLGRNVGIPTERNCFFIKYRLFWNSRDVKDVRYVSYDMNTGDLRYYNILEDFEYIYGIQGDRLIVGKVSRKPDWKSRNDDIVTAYFYDPFNGEYEKFGNLEYEKSIQFEERFGRIFYLYNDKYLIVNNLDGGTPKHYYYYMNTGRTDELPGIDLFSIIEISPDKLTGIIHRDGTFYLYNFSEKKVIKPVEKNYASSLMYLSNNLLLISASDYNFHIYNTEFEKLYDISYTYPDSEAYEYRGIPQWRLWKYNYLTRRVKKTGENNVSLFLYKINNEKEYLNSLNLIFKPTTATANDSRVRIREWPLLDAKNIGYLTKGDELEVLDRSGIKVKIGDMEDYWYKIKRTSDGVEGWSYGYFLNIKE